MVYDIHTSYKNLKPYKDHKFYFTLTVLSLIFRSVLTPNCYFSRQGPEWARRLIVMCIQPAIIWLQVTIILKMQDF